MLDGSTADTDNRSNLVGVLVELLEKVHTLCSYLVRGMQVVMCVCVYVDCCLLSLLYMPLAIEAVGSESSGLYISGGVC